MEGKRITDLKIGGYAEKVNSIVYPNALVYASIVGDDNPIHFETEEEYLSTS